MNKTGQNSLYEGIVFESMKNLRQRVQRFQHGHDFCCTIHNGQGVESVSWPLAETWIKKMWSFYPVIKKNEVLTISEKWMELEISKQLWYS